MASSEKWPAAAAGAAYHVENHLFEVCGNGGEMILNELDTLRRKALGRKRCRCRFWRFGDRREARARSEVRLTS